MKSAIIACVAFAALIGPATAEPRNHTPHALACTKKYGITYEQWRSYKVPRKKADLHRTCRGSQ